MNNILDMIRQGLSAVRKVWIISILVILGLVLGVYSFASGMVGKAAAAIYGKNPVASVNQVVVRPTKPALPGIVETPIAMPTTVQGNTIPSAGGDTDILLTQMKAMTQSLQGVMEKLDQKSANLNSQPVVTPAIKTTIDMQAVMTEMQSINQVMEPLMLRIQADLQGTPSAEELASVRAQVVQINMRIGNLLAQLQAVRGNTGQGMAIAPTMTAIPGGTQQDQGQAMMAKLDEMMLKLQQMQSQQAQPGNMNTLPGTMSGMNMAESAPMQGMSNMDSSMNDMMMTMNEMISMMDGMMVMPVTTSQSEPMPGMSHLGPAIGGMMMDNIMQMMDNMVTMMDNTMKK